MRQIERILLWVDNTEESKIALKYAFELSRVYGSKIIALYCIDSMVVERISKLSSKTRGEIEVELEENAWKYLYYMEELAAHEGIPFTITLVKGNLIDELMKHIDKFKIDLVILRQSKRQTKRHELVKEIVEHLSEYSTAMLLLIDQFSR